MVKKQTAVWLTDEEKEILVRLANKYRISQSALMRILIRRAEEKKMSLSELLETGGGEDEIE